MVAPKIYKVNILCNYALQRHCAMRLRTVDRSQVPFCQKSWCQPFKNVPLGRGLGGGFRNRSVEFRGRVFTPPRDAIFLSTGRKFPFFGSTHNNDRLVKNLEPNTGSVILAHKRLRPRCFNCDIEIKFVLLA